MDSALKSPVRFLFLISFLFTAVIPFAGAAETPRETVARAISTKNAREKSDIISSLAGSGDEALREIFEAWRTDSLYLYAPADGPAVPILLTGEPDTAGAREAVRVVDGEPLVAEDGSAIRVVAASLKTVDHDNRLRRAMRQVLDLLDLSVSNPETRFRAVQQAGFAQDLNMLEILRERLEVEKEPKVLKALREAIALIELKSSDEEVVLAALADLREMHTLASENLILATLKSAEESGNEPVVRAAEGAIEAIKQHKGRVNFFGTIFRGMSLGSVLLIAALGLAITFGLMGVINMAHGEMIAVGAYATYCVQNIFGTGLALPAFGLSLNIPGLNLSGWGYDLYFIIALPVSFLAAALVGLGLERSVIRFLYRRPLESLLATWGVSLVLQQIFRLTFGANNVSVSSPTYLSGNWTINDIIFGWNRVFVIGFAIAIVYGTWLVLTKTPLGLLIRSVMQNRNMAACMGVRTNRVNMLTFALGSGLAGLAGAFLSQIGNVGPSLGQSYIVDCFMVVVVGGVGSIAGTVISALGIGVVDQALQQTLGSPVIGKILVLVGIILFLQWRPAGIFVSRSRSLED